MTRNEPAPANPAPDEADDGDDEGASTNEVLHRLAVGLTRVAMGLEKAASEASAAARSGAERAQPLVARGRELAGKAEEAVKAQAERAGPVVDKATRMASSGRARARTAAAATAKGAHDAASATAHAVDRARGLSLGLALRAEHGAEQAAENLREMSRDLANRGRAARAAGVDFFERHREEIIALILTAAKVAAVIGIRRLARPDDSGPGKGGRGRRMVDAMALLGAVVTHVGELLARNPSALPLLRELYSKGEPAEQAVVGMLVGPALGSDPDHAAQVVREFLEDATSGAAADTIARRTLAPLLRDNPELVEKVLPWVGAASGYVKRAALIALSRRVGDKGSRFGDIVAASVVVLEDHDHEVREALAWLLGAASEVDLEAVAAAVRERVGRLGPEAAGHAKDAIAKMPRELRARIDALEDEDAA